MPATIDISRLTEAELLREHTRVRGDAMRRERAREGRAATIHELATILDDPSLPDPIRPLRRTKVEGHSRSGYRGVWIAYDGVRWVAYLRTRRKRYYCGIHDDPIEAALIRDKFVLKYLPRDRWREELNFEPEFR